MTALSKSAVVCALKNRASSFANRKRGGEAATQTAPFASIGGSSSAVLEMRQFVNEDVLDEGDVRRSRPRVLGFGWPMASRLRGEESAIASAWTEPGLVGVAPLEVRGLARLCALPYRACAAHVRTCSSLDPVVGAPIGDLHLLRSIVRAPIGDLHALRSFVRAPIGDLHVLRSIVRAPIGDLHALRSFVRAPMGDLHALRSFVRAPIGDLHALRSFVRAPIGDLHALRSFVRAPIGDLRVPRSMTHRRVTHARVPSSLVPRRAS